MLGLAGCSISPMRDLSYSLADIFFLFVIVVAFNPIFLSTIHCCEILVAVIILSFVVTLTDIHPHCAWCCTIDPLALQWPSPRRRESPPNECGRIWTFQCVHAGGRGTNNGFTVRLLLLTHSHNPCLTWFLVVSTGVAGFCAFACECDLGQDSCPASGAWPPPVASAAARRGVGKNAVVSIAELYSEAAVSKLVIEAADMFF